MAGEYHDLKKQHYLNSISECAHSGKNKRQWRSENGIKYATFMRWQALLRDEVAEQVMEQQAIVPAKITLPVSVNSVSADASPAETYIRKGKISVILPSSLPVAYILEIIKGSS